MLPLQSSMLSSVAPASKSANAKDAAVSNADSRNSSEAEDSFEDVLAEQKAPASEAEADLNSAQIKETEGKSKTAASGKESDVAGEQEADQADIVFQVGPERGRNTDAERLKFSMATGANDTERLVPSSVGSVPVSVSDQKRSGRDAPVELIEVDVQRETQGRSDMSATASAVSSPAGEPGKKPVNLQTLQTPMSSAMPDGAQRKISGHILAELTSEAGQAIGGVAMAKVPDQPLLPQASIVAQKATQLADTSKTPSGAMLSHFETDEPTVKAGVEVRIQEVATPAPARTVLHPLQSVLQAQMPEQFCINSKGLSIGSVKEASFAPDGFAVGDVLPEHRPTGFQAVMAGHRVDGQLSIPRQISDAIRRTSPGDKIIEVTLTPTELGRVRMVMAPSEAGITINVTAERPETLDLMRRNINDLQSSFAEMGYEDISFSFGQEQADTHDTSGENARQDTPSANLMSATPLSEPAAVQALSYKTTGIDIRV